MKGALSCTQREKMFKISSDTFFEWCDKSSDFVNLNPDYVPDQNEIDELYSYTQQIHQNETSITEQKTGRPMKAETSVLHFIRLGQKGEPYISLENFFKYLIFVSETCEIEKTNVEGQKKLKNLNEYLRKNIELT